MSRLKLNIIDEIIKDSSEEDRVKIGEYVADRVGYDKIGIKRNNSMEEDIKRLRKEIKDRKPSSIRDEMVKAIALLEFDRDVEEYSSIEKIEIYDRKADDKFNITHSVWIEYACDQGWLYEWDTTVKTGDKLEYTIR